jgi:hypothetical protein
MDKTGNRSYFPQMVLNNIFSGHAFTIAPVLSDVLERQKQRLVEYAKSKGLQTASF